MARTYVLGKCLPCINRRVVEKELARERAMRRELREMMTRSRESPDGRMQKLSLHLKTKSFVEQEEQEEFEDDAREEINSKESCTDYDTHQTTCSICMIDIVNGDRIGDLECGHEFHVECLKSWVLWRNTCPLCNASDIATTKVSLVPKQE
ncbi:hypothetical protein CTEN210_12826 [Chaetoceros tenuissimus]|uniref:RING-type E3 ubiquitin transferase n=1 Tax=Chaetoceros tenuissimus TaxID=426638 RepID=A0AAD3D4G5_9STRA|nr:hypothetical protein CTEN210_12826 [Chaetoceros tenuissimus]